MSDPKIVASSQVRPYCLVLKYYVRESIKCSRALGSTRQYRSTRSYFPVRPERLRGFLDHRNVSERRRDSVDDLHGGSSDRRISPSSPGCGGWWVGGGGGVFRGGAVRGGRGWGPRVVCGGVLGGGRWFR